MFISGYFGVVMVIVENEQLIDPCNKLYKVKVFDLVSRSV